MKKLFEVMTTSYRKYYVMAESFDEAKMKVDREILDEEDKKGILDSDGSLRKREELDQVSKIEQLGHKIIT